MHIDACFSQRLQWNAFHIKNSPIIIILLTVANSANFGSGHVRTCAAFNMSLHVRHFQHLKLRETTTIRKVIAQNVQHTREITPSTRRNRQPIVWLPNYFNNLVGEVEAGYFAPRFDTPTMLDLCSSKSYFNDQKVSSSFFANVHKKLEVECFRF